MKSKILPDVSLKCHRKCEKKWSENKTETKWRGREKETLNRDLTLFVELLKKKCYTLFTLHIHVKCMCGGFHYASVENEYRIAQKQTHTHTKQNIPSALLFSHSLPQPFSVFFFFFSKTHANLYIFVRLLFYFLCAHCLFSSDVTWILDLFSFIFTFISWLTTETPNQISDIHQFYTRSHEHPIQVDDMEYKMASSSSNACESIPTKFISIISLAFNMICMIWLTVHPFQ